MTNVAVKREAKSNQLLQREDSVSRDAMTKSVSELAAWMQANLSQQLTAYMTDLKDPKVVGRWAAGKSEPKASRLWRLQQGYIAARVLTDEFGERTARSWFMGSNRALDDQSPAAVLRESDEKSGVSIIPAARAFAEGAF